MPLLRNIEIKDFRAIADVKLELNRVNVIVGRNNTGKTSILEALALLLTSYNDYKDALGNDVLKLVASRGGYTYLKRINAEMAVIKAQTTNGEELSLYFVTDKNGLEKLSDIPILQKAVHITISRIVDEEIEKKIRDLEAKIDELKRRTTPFSRTFLTFTPTGPYDEELNETQRLLKLYKESRDVAAEKTRQELLRKFSFLSIALINNEPIGAHLTIKSEFYEETKSAKFKEYKPPVLVNVGLQRDAPNKSSILDKLPVDVLIDALEKLKNIIPYFYDYRNGMIIFNYAGRREIVPLSSVGAGFLTFLDTLITAILGINVNIIEEPEMHMHPSFLEQFCRELLNIIDTYDIQYIMTTHSIEFLQYLFEYAKDLRKLDIINVIRMYRLPNGEIDYEVLNGKAAIEELEDIKGDLRGP
ncbi:MAG: AAA family ATPase [Candidatus Baldrarchaeia archaeon]